MIPSYQKNENELREALEYFFGKDGILKTQLHKNKIFRKEIKENHVKENIINIFKIAFDLYEKSPSIWSIIFKNMILELENKAPEIDLKDQYINIDFLLHPKIRSDGSTNQLVRFDYTYQFYTL